MNTLSIPTPRTDAALIEKLTCSEGGDHECTVYPAEEIVDASFARGLEREAVHHSAQLEKALGRIAQLEAGLKTITELANDAPELNMKNYSENDVSILNDFMTAIHQQCALLHPDSTKKS